MGASSSAPRLYNLSSFSMMVLGILVGAAAMQLVPNVPARMWSLRVQGLLLAVLLLELGVLFKLLAALRICSRGNADDRSEEQTARRRAGLFRGAALLFLALGALNLGATFWRAPTAADVARARQVSTELAARISELASDLVITGLLTTAGLGLLALFSLATALTFRYDGVESRSGW